MTIDKFLDEKALYNHIAREAVRSVLTEIEGTFIYKEMDPMLQRTLDGIAEKLEIFGTDESNYPTILLPLHWKYCEAILDRKKTIEIRLSFPTFLTPLRVLLYATKDTKPIYRNGKLASGKVVGEFICRDCISIRPRAVSTPDSDYWITSDMLSQTCLTSKELSSYGKGRILYGWIIEKVEEYPTYHELKEFKKFSDKKPLITAPQSYCRIERPTGLWE